jgi:hypothetical protein
MIDWAARAKSVLTQHLAEATDKTDESRVSSVSSVGAQAVLANRKGTFSSLVSDKPTQVVAPNLIERDDLAGTPAGAVVNSCGNCLHLLRHGTCGRPVTAGLLSEEDGFGIVWPAEGQGASCPAFTSKVPAAADVQTDPADTVGANTVITATLSQVMCLAAYDYEVPDDGLMHGVPTRD